MSDLARWCFRHRRFVLAIWLIALVVTGGASGALGSNFATKFQLPNTQSAQALNLLQKDFPAASGSSDQIVVAVDSGTVTDPAVESVVSKMLAAVAQLPDVRAVSSPYKATGKAQISKDAKVAFATVIFDGQVGGNSPADVRRVVSTAEAVRSSTLQVALGGQDIEQLNSQAGSSSTIAGVIFALIVLGLAFGALFSALLPIITALIAIGIGTSVTTILSHVLSIASFAPLLGVLIGLGVGVDYALFILTRHRSAIKAGKPIEDAAVEAINTSGRAVFFAGITVCIALMGQFVLGLSFLYGLAISASVTVLLTMFASITLLPALLGFFRSKVLSRRERRSLAERGPELDHVSGLWSRWSSFIERRPGLPAVVALLVVVAIGLPIFTLRLGLDDASSDPPGSTTLQAYQLLARGFGPGFNGPLLLVAQLPNSADEAAFAAVASSVAKVPGIVSVAPVITNPARTVAIATVYPTTSPQAAQTTILVDKLRSDVIPKAETGSGLTVLVGGQTAIQTDFAHILASKLVYFVAAVVILGFILLMAVFRSLVVPLVASVMNILSVGASLGILNAVFEWGWGHSLLRISSKVPVEVFLPVILLSILFGLSMDYEVFLVSRMREEWVAHRDASRAVTVGQSATGRVITAAATIMILVFASFALGNNVVIKQFGIGLAGAIFVDAFVIRTVLVPSVMHMLGKSNWWLPAWLDKAIPHLNIEGVDNPGGDLRDDEPALTAP